MEWTDSGIVLAVRPHGETSAIIEVLTPGQGRHAGLVRGARSRSLRPILQPGNEIRVAWRARLADHLGQFQVEPDSVSAGVVMEDRTALAGLNAACAMAILALPEREQHEAVYDGFRVFLNALEHLDIWPALYVRWEAGLLSDLGYGLDWEKCAVTGPPDDLTHISPRTGRAVCAEAAGVAGFSTRLRTDRKRRYRQGAGTDRLFPGTPRTLAGRQAITRCARAPDRGAGARGAFIG